LEELEGDIEYASLSEFHRFEIPEGCHWKDVRETTTNVELVGKFRDLVLDEK